MGAACKNDGAQKIQMQPGGFAIALDNDLNISSVDRVVYTGISLDQF